MKVDWGVEIAGSGIGLPRTVMSNHDWVARLNTSDEWIVQRTGIRERRVAAEGESTLTFALQASQEALQSARVAPQEIDLIICGTITPDHLLPSTACELQAALGCGHVPAFDLVAACSGFVYGLITAAQYIVAGMSRNALVVGADCVTRMADWEDRQSAILFGDGAGAVVLRPSCEGRPAIRAVRLGADGGRAMLIWVPAGGSREPASLRTVNERLHVMRMKGRDVYKFAVSKMQEVIVDTLADAELTLDDVALVVPHQSNLRIIESACDRLGLPEHKVFINIQRVGNTSAASVPIALHEALRTGRLRRGDLVLLVAFGAGLTWASCLMEV
jgi:3-oxoacyl-[acyl-carrier-protein] synthase-3